MIKIINGTYGYKNPNTGFIEAKTAKSEPFSLTPEREKELVDEGIAEYADAAEKADRKSQESAPKEAPEYGPFKTKEQNIKAAKFYGIKGAEKMKNKEIVEAIKGKLAEDLPELKAEMPV